MHVLIRKEGKDTGRSQLLERSLDGQCPPSPKVKEANQMTPAPQIQCAFSPVFLMDAHHIWVLLSKQPAPHLENII